MSAEPTARLTRGRLAPRVFRFGLPLALAMGFHGLFNCVDLVIVGRLGPGAIAAVTAAGIIVMVAMLLFNGVANMMAALVGQLAGEGRHDDAREAATDALRLTLWLSIGLGGAFFLAAQPLLSLLATDAETSRDAVRYLQIMSLGAGTMFVLLWGTAVLRATGESVWPMAVLIGSNVLNVVLDVLLVFGRAGLPRLEVAGAAWATVIARAAGGLVVVAVLHRRGGVRLGELLRWRAGPDAAMLLRKGAMSSAQMVVRVVGIYGLLAVATGPAAREAGVEAARDLLDGIGICIRLEMIVVFFGLGWGAAAGAVVAQNVGASLPARASAGAWLCYLHALGFAVAAGALLLLLDEPVFRAFAPGLGETAYAGASKYLAFAAPAWGPLLVGVVLSQALAGAGVTRTPLLVDTAVHLVLLVTAAWWLGQHHGLTGCWTALVACHALSAAVYGFVFRRGAWVRSSRLSRPAG